jgi:hypothetical protein
MDEMEMKFKKSLRYFLISFSSSVIHFSPHLFADFDLYRSCCRGAQEERGDAFDKHASFPQRNHLFVCVYFFEQLADPCDERFPRSIICWLKGFAFNIYSSSL